MLVYNMIELNNGFHCTGPFSLRANEILNSVEDLYINEEIVEMNEPLYVNLPNEVKGVLFNQVYPGMVVKFRGDNGKFEIWINKDNSPYLPGSEVGVSSSNVEQYWDKIWPKQVALGEATERLQNNEVRLAASRKKTTKNKK